MNIYAKSGDRVIFDKPDNGMEDCRQIANTYLEVGKVYTVDYTEVGGWYTSVYLKEFPNIAFNSVLFSDYDRKN